MARRLGHEATLWQERAMKEIEKKGFHTRLKCGPCTKKGNGILNDINSNTDFC